FVPANSYIDATAFGTPAELAAYLRHLLETPSAYEAYFAWRSQPLPESIASRLPLLETPAKCRLAELVHQRMQQGQGLSPGWPSLPFGGVSFLRTKLRRWRKSR
ncbi:MAG: alpha-1,3-fucosyltransferase, partial [Mesorhizobium sp.]